MLLTTVLVGVLWVSSYFIVFWMNGTTAKSDFGLFSESGRVCFNQARWSSAQPRRVDWEVGTRLSFPIWHEIDVAANWHSAGFSYTWSSANTDRAAYLLITIPYWFLFLLLFFPLAIVLIQVYRNRHHEAQRCQSCGYDLRVSSGNCPECGQKITDGIAQS